MQQFMKLAYGVETNKSSKKLRNNSFHVFKNCFFFLNLI